MGLDMYLTGRKFYTHDNRTIKDGFEVKAEELELAYWRKHPDLHGYIVNNFADGEDNCQDIELSADNLDQIITAVNTESLPHTEGFFFGSSDGSEREETNRALVRARDWLKSEKRKDKVWRSVVYCASW